MKKRVLTFLLLFASFCGYAQMPVSEFWSTRVADRANILTPEFENDLERQLKSYEDSTTNQIVIFTISTLDGVPIEDYSLRVAEDARAGQADKDNGVVLFIAVEDRKVRIEVGEGLEGVLPDAICNQIIRNQIAPNFRKNDYESGIRDAVTAIVQAIGGEYRAEQGPPVKKGRRGGSLWGTLVILAIFILISRIRGGGRGNNRGGWSSGTGWYGGGFGGRGFGGGGGGGGFGGFSGGGGGFSGGGSSGSW